MDANKTQERVGSIGGRCFFDSNNTTRISSQRPNPLASPDGNGMIPARFPVNDLRDGMYKGPGVDVGPGSGLGFKGSRFWDIESEADPQYRAGGGLGLGRTSRHG
ncbi:hypothetical protein AB3S75_006207 [Citrus x aurantiifolia]